MRIAIRWIFGVCLCWHTVSFAADLGNQPTNQSQPKAKVTKPVAKVNTQAKRASEIAPPAMAMQPTEVVPENLRSEVANQVHTGRMQCELGVVVNVTPDPNNAHMFMVQINQHKFQMLPVVTSTGAIRLEDAQAGAMWLQLANKSMLMNSKIGQRMADECQSPDQAAVAQAMKLAPPQSLLEGPAVAKK